MLVSVSVSNWVRKERCSLSLPLCRKLAYLNIHSNIWNWLKWPDCIQPFDKCKITALQALPSFQLISVKSVHKYERILIILQNLQRFRWKYLRGQHKYLHSDSLMKSYTRVEKLSWEEIVRLHLTISVIIWNSKMSEWAFFQSLFQGPNHVILN